MTYIANRPVRFDRNYAIGEIIPAGVIDQKMTTRLINMGRIIRIADPESAQDAAPDGAEAPQGGDSGGSGTNTHAGAENAAEGKSGGTEGESADSGTQGFKCAECGRVFTTANGLASHSRAHKK